MPQSGLVLVLKTKPRKKKSNLTRIFYSSILKNLLSLERLLSLTQSNANSFMKNTFFFFFFLKKGMKNIKKKKKNNIKAFFFLN